MKKILLVEDNQAVAKLVLRKLKKQAEYEVQHATNGQLAVDLAFEFDPDLILMDMHMPVMDGHEATKALRKLGFKRKIIAFTASVSNNDKELAKTSGCDEVIAKPIPENFIEIIKDHL